MADPRPPWLAVPPPVAALFARVPLRVYPADALPARAPARALRPRLYLFARDNADAARPSFNPSCLKWQTYLRIAGVDVDVVPASNHASPSGALPCLVVPPDDAGPPRAAVPLTGAAIARYAREHASRRLPADDDDDASPRLDAYRALVTTHIRPAWLYALYLVRANTPLLASLYLPGSALLRAPLLRALRAAAAAELRPPADPAALLADARAALAALDALLAARGPWFSGAPAPCLFDADVFAYTFLILDPAMAWRDDAGLAACLTAFDNLVRHRAALYESCWGPNADTKPARLERP